jgi:hypothetical protein
MTYNFEPIQGNCPAIAMRLLNGIGDLCWCAVKLANFKKTYKINNLYAKMHLAGDYRDSRSKDFIKRFTFFNRIEFEQFPIHQNPISIEQRLNYVPSKYSMTKNKNNYTPSETKKNLRSFYLSEKNEKYQNKYRQAPVPEYTFIVNPYIEWDGRIEEIWPDVPPCHDFFFTHYRINPQDTKSALSLTQQGKLFNTDQKGYFCIHLGCTANNTHNGMNRFENWSIQNWFELCQKLNSISNFPIYIIGAAYDNEYATKLTDLTDQYPELKVINLCAKYSTLQTIEILRNASLVVSFASGIGIAATYLKTPTIMFWMPEYKSVSPYDDIRFHRNFATNWVPPDLINQIYYPAYYFEDTTQSVFDKCSLAIENHLNNKRIIRSL